MSSEVHSTTPARTRWGLITALLGVAVVPPILLVTTEAGTAAWAWAAIFGANAAFPSVLRASAEVDTVVWAWAIFFGVTAAIAAAEYVSSGRMRNRPEGGDEPDDVPDASANEAAVRTLRGFGGGEARAGSETAPKCDPALVSVWVEKGLAFNTSGKYEEAIRCYDKALALDPRNPAACHNKGNSLCAAGRYEEALRCYNEALVADPRDPKAWNNRGGCLVALGRQDEAILCYSKALEVDPSYAAAWRAKALVLERLGRKPDAVEAYKQFVALAIAQGLDSAEQVKQHISELEKLADKKDGSPGSSDEPQQG